MTSIAEVHNSLSNALAKEKEKCSNDMELFVALLRDKSWKKAKTRKCISQPTAVKLYADPTAIGIPGFSADFFRKLKKMCKEAYEDNSVNENIEEGNENMEQVNDSAVDDDDGDDDEPTCFKDFVIEEHTNKNFKRLNLFNKQVKDKLTLPTIPRFELLLWCGGGCDPLTDYMHYDGSYGDFYRPYYSVGFRRGGFETTDEAEAGNVLFWEATKHPDTAFNMLFTMFYVAIKNYTGHKIGGHGYMRESVPLLPTSTRSKYDENLSFVKSLVLLRRAVDATLLHRDFQLPENFQTLLECFYFYEDSLNSRVAETMQSLFMNFRSRNNKVGALDFVAYAMPCIYQFFTKSREYEDLHEAMSDFREHVRTVICSYRQSMDISDDGQYPGCIEDKFGKGYFEDVLIQKILKDCVVNFKGEGKGEINIRTNWDICEVQQAMRGSEKLIMQKGGCDVAFYFYLKALELMSMPSLDIEREEWAIKVGNIRKQAAHKKLIAKREKFVAAMEQHFLLLSETKAGDGGVSHLFLPHNSENFAKEAFLTVKGYAYDKMKEKESVSKKDTEYFADLCDVGARGIAHRIVYYAKLVADVEFKNDEEEKKRFYTELFPPMERTEWSSSVSDESKKKSMRKRARHNRLQPPPQLEVCCVPQKKGSSEAMIGKIMNAAIFLLKKNEVFTKALLVEAECITGRKYHGGLNELSDGICNAYAYVNKRGKGEVITKKRLREEIQQGSRNMLSHGLIKKRKLSSFVSLQTVPEETLPTGSNGTQVTEEDL